MGRGGELAPGAPDERGSREPAGRGEHVKARLTHRVPVSSFRGGKPRRGSGPESPRSYRIPWADLLKKVSELMRAV